MIVATVNVWGVWLYADDEYKGRDSGSLLGKT